MVRRILDGTKTETRRLITERHGRVDLLTAWLEGDPATTYEVAPDGTLCASTHGGFGKPGLRCPYGGSDDRLWVRETWAASRIYDGVKPSDIDRGAKIAFAASGGVAGLRLRPAIFCMPWMSRVTLPVASVRVERLQDISKADALAEGLSVITKDGGITWKHGIPDRDGLPGTDNDGWPWAEWHVDPRNAYARLWDSINAERAPWSSNPWVWVISWKEAEVRRAA